MWAQRGDPREVGYTKYYYTGWQKDILPATFDVATCPELAPPADKYDEWVAIVGYQSANHYIVTRYADGAHSIGQRPINRAELADNSCEDGRMWAAVPTAPQGRARTGARRD